MGAVFINYRREETSGEARALFNDLVARLGENSVFMDVDNIGLGRDFRQVIQQRLASCELMLALIGKNWVGAKNQSGRRRLDDTGDFVRLEIEAALKRNIPVTPVLLQGAQMPSVDELPESVRDFAYRNGFEISHNRWESDVQEMIKRLGLGATRSGKGAAASAPAGSAPAHGSVIEQQPAAPAAAPAPRPSRKPLYLLVSALVMAIAVGGGGLLYYEKGTEEKATAERVEVERAKARAAAAETAAREAEAGKAKADAEAANARAAAAQAEKDRLAAAQSAKERALATQAERDRLVAAQAEKDRAAAAQLAQERALAAQAERDRAAAAAQAERERAAAAQAAQARALAAQAERDRAAAAQAAEIAAAARAAQQVNLSGIWREQTRTGVVTYAVQQSGNNFIMVASVPGQGVVGRGQGVISGNSVAIKYSMRNAIGQAMLTLSPDGTELKGYFRLSTGESGQASLHR